MTQHLFEARGIDPQRLSVAGQGEHQPIADNATVEGRNRNRRVTLVILDTAVASAAPAQDPPAMAGAAQPVAATAEAAP